MYTRPQNAALRACPIEVRRRSIDKGGTSGKAGSGKTPVLQRTMYASGRSLLKESSGEQEM